MSEDGRLLSVMTFAIPAAPVILSKIGKEQSTEGYFF